MLINRDSTDIIIIDTDGDVVFDDIGNYHYFGLGIKTFKEKILGSCFLILMKAILCSKP